MWDQVHAVLRAGLGIQTIGSDYGVIHAATEMNWRTWGERITVSLTPVPEGTNVAIRMAYGIVRTAGEFADSAASRRNRLGCVPALVCLINRRKDLCGIGYARRAWIFTARR